MLLFSTVLKIKETMKINDFIQLVIEWNKSNPYEENIIRGISWNGERNIRFGNEKLWLEIIDHKKRNIIAVRYEKVGQDGAIWDTDYVMNFDEMKMAIRLDRSYLEEAVVSDAVFSTPYFINLLMDKGYVCPDGDLEFRRGGTEVTEENVQLLAGIITGKATYTHPVVYVSKTVDNLMPLSLEQLCNKLKGTAHVLVQQDKNSNNAIRMACNGSNEYYGTIGVYFPNDSLGHRKRFYNKYNSEETFLNLVVKSVLEYGVLQRIDSLYTFQGVSNALLNDSLEAQRSERIEAERARDEAQSEIRDFHSNFDEELETLKRQVNELTQAHDILFNENRELRKKVSSLEGKSNLFRRNEEDLYEGELADVLIDAIRDYLKQINREVNRRRADVLEDIICNNGISKLRDEKKKEIKKCLKGYSSVSGSLKRDLQILGFSIAEEGKHYKLKYHNDSRYTFILAKTPSDNKDGENMASTICRTVL